jgi:hypothetical protein
LKLNLRIGSRANRGQPVEVGFRRFERQNRTPLEYILKPLREQLARAF